MKRPTLLALLLIVCTLPSWACTYFVSNFCEVAKTDSTSSILRARVHLLLEDRAQLEVISSYRGDLPRPLVWVYDLPEFDCNGALFRGDTEDFGPEGSEILVILNQQLDSITGLPTGDYLPYYRTTNQFFLRLEGGFFQDRGQPTDVMVLPGMVESWLRNCVGEQLKGRAPLGRWTLYPNPAYAQVWLRLDQEGSAWVEIWNVLGQRLFAGEVTHEGSIDLLWLPAGNYFVRIHQSGIVEQRQLIKLHG